MCELVWGELGKFVNKRCVRRKHPLYARDGQKDCNFAYRPVARRSLHHLASAPSR